MKLEEVQQIADRELQQVTECNCDACSSIVLARALLIAEAALKAIDTHDRARIVCDTGIPKDVEVAFKEIEQALAGKRPFGATWHDPNQGKLFN